MTKRSGRCVRIEYEYNGKQETTYDHGHSHTIMLYEYGSLYPQSGGTETISFNDSTFNIYENETKVGKEFNQIEIGYFSGGKDYITNYSYENNVITVTIPPNISNTERKFYVDLRYSVNWEYSTDNTYLFRFQYYQQGIETT